MSATDNESLNVTQPIAAPAREPDFGFQNSYSRLPESFYTRTSPTPVAAPRLVKLNTALAVELNLDPAALAGPAGVEVLGGNRLAAGSEPLALAYAGNQFGYFVPRLGDGRAILLGEVTGRDGVRYDLQLKGSGPTPFSRRGDGRAALGPVLREYLVSEAMAAFGVPTTRSLAAVATGQPVFRETVQPGAVLTRVAASHLRIGTFQYFAAQKDAAALKTLADYAIARHYPDIADSAQRYRAFLNAVISRQARLIAQWMLLGFIHGVMNTDNMSISGETIDYGPCAFMEAYDPHTVFSSIDQQGRYCYSNQPHAAHWNLTRLAEAVLPLLEQETGSQEAGLASAYEALAEFGPQFEAARSAGFGRKLGFFTAQPEDDALLQELLNQMAASEADFTLTFRRLGDAAAGPANDAALLSLFADKEATRQWLSRWRKRLASETISSETRVQAMQQTNPLFLPRNHLVQEALVAAADRQDFEPFEELLAVLARPFDDRPGLDRYTQPARPEERVLQTFCGT